MCWHSGVRWPALRVPQVWDAELKCMFGTTQKHLPVIIIKLFDNIQNAEIVRNLIINVDLVRLVRVLFGLWNAFYMITDGGRVV